MIVRKKKNENTFCNRSYCRFSVYRLFAFFVHFRIKGRSEMIQCEECGRWTADYHAICPECGNPLADYEDEIEDKDAEEIDCLDDEEIEDEI